MTVLNQKYRFATTGSIRLVVPSCHAPPLPRLGFCPDMRSQRVQMAPSIAIEVACCRRRDDDSNEEPASRNLVRFPHGSGCSHLETRGLSTAVHCPPPSGFCVGCRVCQGLGPRVSEMVHVMCWAVVWWCRSSSVLSTCMVGQRVHRGEVGGWMVGGSAPAYQGSKLPPSPGKYWNGRTPEEGGGNPPPLDPEEEGGNPPPGPPPSRPPSPPLDPPPPLCNRTQKICGGEKTILAAYNRCMAVQGASVLMCSGMPCPCCLFVLDRPWNAFSLLKRQ